MRRLKLVDSFFSYKTTLFQLRTLYRTECDGKMIMILCNDANVPK